MSNLDKSERAFLEILQRYSKGIRAATSKPVLAEQAAIYEQWFQDLLDRDKSPLPAEVKA